MSAVATFAMLLIVAVTPLVACWRCGVTRDIEQFLGAAPLSFAAGVGLSLATWTTVNTLMAAPEVTYRLGIMGALAYSAIGALGLIGYGWFYGRMARNWPGVATVGEFVRRRFGPPLHPLFLVAVLVYVMGALTAPVHAGGVLLEHLLGVPHWASAVALYGITALVVALGGFPAVLRTAVFQVVLLLMIVLVLPALVYLNLSIPPVYEGIILRAPHAFSFATADGWLFLGGGAFLALGEVLMDNSFWLQASALTPHKARFAFPVAGVAWAFIPFAMSTLAFVGLATLPPVNPVLVVALVVERYAGPLGLWALSLCVSLAALSSMGAILNGLVSLVVREWEACLRDAPPASVRLRRARSLALILSIVPLGISTLGPVSLIDMLIWLGVINAAFLGPFLIGVWGGRGLTALGATVAVLLSLGLGYLLYVHFTPMFGVIASGLCSLAGCGLLAAVGARRTVPTSGPVQSGQAS